MTINKRNVIEKYIKRLGNTIQIEKEDGSVMEDKALIQNAWTRQHLRYDRHAAQPGRYGSRYWLYIGPPSLNITVLSEKDTLLYDDEHYYFIQTEAVKVGEHVQYYRGILKKTEEEDDVFIE